MQVVGLCHKTVGPETVCVIYGEEQLHCQPTLRNKKPMAQAISTKAPLAFLDFTRLINIVRQHLGCFAHKASSTTRCQGRETDRDGKCSLFRDWPAPCYTTAQALPNHRPGLFQVPTHATTVTPTHAVLPQSQSPLQRCSICPVQEG